MNMLLSSNRCAQDGAPIVIAKTTATIVSLPVEIITLIFDWIPADTVWNSCRFVNRFFYGISSTDDYWKGRLMRRRHRVNYPLATLRSRGFNWAVASHYIESSHSLWRNGSAYTTVTNGHFASVDAIHLLRGSNQSRYFVSGGRDRTINLWNLDALAAPFIQKLQAHKGWIWSIASNLNDPGCFYSAGWDCYVNQWALNNCNIETTSTWKLGAAVLDVAICGRNVVASSYDHKVTVVDPREANDQRVAVLDYHKGPVLGVAVSDDNRFIYSCGEDKRIACIDARTMKPLSTRTLKRFAHHIHYANGTLSLGCGGGYVIIVDANDSTMPTLVSRQITGAAMCRVPQVYHDLGSTIAISADKYLRVFEGGTSLQAISVTGPLPSEPSRFDYFEGALVCAMSDGSIGVFDRRNESPTAATTRSSATDDIA